MRLGLLPHTWSMCREEGREWDPERPDFTPLQGWHTAWAWLFTAQGHRAERVNLVHSHFWGGEEGCVLVQVCCGNSCPFTQKYFYSLPTLYYTPEEAATEGTPGDHLPAWPGWVSYCSAHLPQRPSSSASSRKPSSRLSQLISQTAHP